MIKFVVTLSEDRGFLAKGNSFVKDVDKALSSTMKMMFICTSKRK